MVQGELLSKSPGLALSDCSGSISVSISTQL